MRLVIMITCIICACSCNAKHSSVEEKNTATQTTDTLSSNNIQKDSVASIVPEHSVTAAELITPGKSIGSVTVGVPTSEIVKVLGTPDFGDAAMGKSVSGWYSKSDPSHQTKIYSIADYNKENAVPRVQQVRVNSPYFKTEQGLQTGSGKQEILQYFPGIKQALEYEAEPGGSMVQVMDDNSNGIAFEIGPDGSCRGITVHAPGKQLFNYLPFYGK